MARNPLDLDISVGRRIALRRQEVGLSQEEVARSMRLSQQSLSHLETGHRSARIDQLAHLGMMMGVSVAWFLADEAQIGNDESVTDSFFDRNGLRIATALAARPELKNIIAVLLDATVQRPERVS